MTIVAGSEVWKTSKGKSSTVKILLVGKLKGTYLDLLLMLARIKSKQRLELKPDFIGSALPSYLA